MKYALKLVGVLLTLFIASCSSMTGLSKKSPASCAAEPDFRHMAAKARTAALGELPVEAELCASAPRGEPQREACQDEDSSCTVADIFNGKRHPRVPDLQFPVPSGVLSSPFGYRRGVFHSGLDIRAPKGEPIRACADGQVSFTGSRKGFRSYGQMVMLDHGKSVCTHYAHLSKILVTKGRKVRKGEVIALVGSTGRSTAPHLHLEVRVGDQLYNPYVHFAKTQLKGIEIAKGFNCTPMGPVRPRR